MMALKHEIISNKPKGTTHFNSNGTIFPYEKHTAEDVYVWANGVWELTNVPSCAEPIKPD